MADKPSRGLVLYGDGLMKSVTPSHTHLHELASRGTCGFLSLHQSPPSEVDEQRVVRELAQLLDSHEFCIPRSGSEHLVPNLSERFMGLRAAIYTNDSNVASFAGLLGFTVIQLDDLLEVSGLLKLLGFEGGKPFETCEFDLLFVHIDGSRDEVELMNGLVSGILEIAKLGSEISSRLHLSVVMSYGTLAEDEDSLLNFTLVEETTPDVSLLLPRQTYTISGKDSVNIRHHCPMLIAQWQDAVTRKDLAERFSFQEFKENGANLAIPANRFLHELAFKMWKAPKYGA